MRDATLSVPVTVLINHLHPMGKVRVGILARAQASRRDFHLLADSERECGGVLVGKDVVITVDAKAILQE